MNDKVEKMIGSADLQTKTWAFQRKYELLGSNNVSRPKSAGRRKRWEEPPSHILCGVYDGAPADGGGESRATKTSAMGGKRRRGALRPAPEGRCQEDVRLTRTVLPQKTPLIGYRTGGYISVNVKKKTAGKFNNPFMIVQKLPAN